MEKNFKILTWNCGGAFRKKYESISKLDADVYVIQECEDPERTNDENYKKWKKTFFWVGENKNKGLGVFANEGVDIVDLSWDAEGLKYFIACRVYNEFNVLATWCHGANSPTFGYIGQLWKYMQLHKSRFGKSIIA